MLKITNTWVFHNGKFIDKEIGIDDGLIVKIGNIGEADETIDGKGLWLLPGLVDAHVHMREPGATHKEDFLTGSKAAIAGGFTSIIDMPNNNPPTISMQALKEKELLAKKALCEVSFHFGTSSDNFQEIKKLNPQSLKLYMDETTGNLSISDQKIIERHFENFDKDRPVVVHAEGKNIEKAISLAKKCNRRIHIAHAPTKQAVEQAKQFEKATIEVAPHHLFLSEKYAHQNASLGAVKPALQSETDRKQLWQALSKADCIASDHAPHILEEKANGAYGFPGLETAFGLMLKAYYEKQITFPWLIERLAENPAKIFNLEKTGKIEKGYKANLILIDLKKEWIVKGEELQTKCKWSPFEGWKLKGKVLLAIVKGKIICQEGEFL